MKSPELRNKKLLPLLAVVAAGGVALDGKLSNTHPTKAVDAPLVKRVNYVPETAVRKTVSEASSAKKSPVIYTYPLQNTFDGENIPIVAVVKPGKLGDHIESAKFSLTYPKNVPAGVSLGKSRHVMTPQGEEVVAQFNDPSDPNLRSGQVEVNVSATESNGATSTVQEEIPYSPQPPPPN